MLVPDNAPTICGGQRREKKQRRPLPWQLQVTEADTNKGVKKREQGPESYKQKMLSQIKASCRKSKLTWDSTNGWSDLERAIKEHG